MKQVMFERLWRGNDRIEKEVRKFVEKPRIIYDVL